VGVSDMSTSSLGSRRGAAGRRRDCIRPGAVRRDCAGPTSTVERANQYCAVARWRATRHRPRRARGCPRRLPIGRRWARPCAC
jgi:hypothetical protein